ncbi:hypothetical protein JDV02_010475 [Purpureocillium takamizusanense]|uniref:Uncharacterized protein n=1 Tax=Purpureocillium takamizusanense TaxID=2060973 RepID=A0A9Q8QS31_9HYPO|nr:uncharacterized protein JDV02_010475 [Purpureocillium takamizusanense]UNI24750.1 hypothetical protein JDV02_010475 [Purpureocillium takamizusanense]
MADNSSRVAVCSNQSQEQQPAPRPILMQSVPEHLNYSIQRFADASATIPADHPGASSLRPPPGFSSPTPTTAEAVARAQAIVAAVDAVFHTHNGTGGAN